MGWRLKRTRQCKKCPWRKDVDPNDIPNGYDVEKHCALRKTIADGNPVVSLEPTIHVMACHETEDAHCIGWLNNQLGPGNNIPLRLRVRSCENIKDIRLIGEQHSTFDDTLPKQVKCGKRGKVRATRRD